MLSLRPETKYEAGCSPAQRPESTACWLLPAKLLTFVRVPPLCIPKRDHSLKYFTRNPGAKVFPATAGARPNGAYLEAGAKLLYHATSTTAFEALQIHPSRCLALRIAKCEIRLLNLRGPIFSAP